MHAGVCLLYVLVSTIAAHAVRIWTITLADCLQRSLRLYRALSPG